MPPVTGLAESGYIYVPSGCEKPGARCKLHFSLHGCGVNEYYDGASFAKAIEIRFTGRGSPC